MSNIIDQIRNEYNQQIDNLSNYQFQKGVYEEEKAKLSRLNSINHFEKEGDYESTIRQKSVLNELISTHISKIQDLLNNLKGLFDLIPPEYSFTLKNDDFKKTIIKREANKLIITNEYLNKTKETDHIDFSSILNNSLV